MRITTGMMSERYIRNLNKSANKMYYLNEKVQTGRKFFKGSEDPIAAIKAYKLRREYRTTEIYDKNIQEVDSVFVMAETNLMEISDNLESIYKSSLRGITGTMNAESREVIAKELDNLQNAILTSLNSKVGDRYVFGGSSKESIPFTVDKDGNLFYKGINVNTTDDNEKLKLEELAKEEIYMDVGLGMSFKNGELNTDTAFNISFAGIKIVGYGTDDKGISNNLYTLIGGIKEKLRDPNFSMEKIDPYLTKFEEQKKEILVNVTDVGTKTNYLEFLKYRNESNQINLNKKILDVEYVDQAEAIVDFSTQRYAYNAALAMGNKILENSFIDFMK